MSKNRNRGKAAPSTTPQGNVEYPGAAPKSQLEQAAKKSNTKI